MSASPWRIYDDLIDLVPQEARATRILVGGVVVVCSDDGGCGIAARQRGGPRVPASQRPEVGARLRDVAAGVRSWDLELASIGAAALTCALNTPARVAPFAAGHDQGDAFTRRADELAERRVVMVGHFDRAARTLRGACDLTILERDPHGEDLPDPACEYVLPQADTVFLTGMTVANKTLPRLAALSAGATTILTGPSSPFAPEAFTGILDEIDGSVVADPARVVDLVARGARLRELHPVLQRFAAPLGRGPRTADPAPGGDRR